MTLPSSEPGRHPLLDESPLPYGLPDFAAIDEAELEPAIRTAIDDHAAEVAAIVANPEPPSVDNTVIALEQSGQALHRVLSVFYGLLGPDATPSRLDVDRVVSPLLAAHHSAIMTDPRLFGRVDAVYSALDAGELEVDDETGRLVRRHHRDLLRAGAALGDADRARLTAIDTRLAELTTLFGENLLASTAALAVPVTDEAELAG
ncbi:M3 family metallopeptidase, partial [Dietzia sp. SLG310A2-38A2]|nr:M3 family metallopeptidase [Dietzia sp. SLG310A2-38A2]